MRWWRRGRRCFLDTAAGIFSCPATIGRFGSGSVAHHKPRAQPYACARRNAVAKHAAAGKCYACAEPNTDANAVSDACAGSNANAEPNTHAHTIADANA